MRWVVYHEELGVFLGTYEGFKVWSKRSPVTCSAITFARKRDALLSASPVDGILKLCRVLPDYDEIYATIGECVRVGLPAWIVNKN